MIKHLIVGVNERLYDLVPNLEGEVVVVDVTQSSQFMTFDHEKIQPLYQASLLSGQVSHPQFEDSFNFYDHIANQQVELNYIKKRELLEYLKNRHIEVVKGRIKLVNEHQVEVSYLGETQIFNVENLILNTNQDEENPHESPFIFTFDQLINTNQLFEHILVIASSLRALEIASMYNRFGSKVSLVTDRRLFSQISHLQFRDAIRASLIGQNIKLFEKYEAKSFKDDGQRVHVDIVPQSQLAFEIGEPAQPQTLIVDAIVIENLSDDRPLNQDVLFLNPTLALFNSETKGKVFQIDLQDLTYFNSRLDFEGGIEYRVNEDKIVGATFYCQNAVELKQILETLQDLSLDEFRNLKVLNNSLLGVLKESAQLISRNEEQHDG